jgi:spore germination protein GerM
MNRHIRLTFLLASAVLIATACSGGIGSRGAVQTPFGSAATSSPAPTPESTTTPSARPTRTPDESGEPAESGATPEPMVVVAYFLMDDPSGQTNPTLVPVRRIVEPTRAVGRAALEQLLSPPLPGDYEADVGGISTAIPEGTVLLGLDIESGLATVDLSREFESGGGSYSMGARLAQVVYTLTRFPTVERVAFRLDGEPVTVFSAEGLVLDEPVDRDDYLDYLPPVFVDSPPWGSVIFGPPIENDVPGRYLTVEASGLANVFEAQFFAALLDSDGNVLDEKIVMAACGTGCWGEFEVTLGSEVPAELTLRVWTLSARDGSVEFLREYRIDFAPEESEDGCGC